MSDEVFEIVKAALNIARNQQVKSLAELRDRLSVLYPHNNEGINEAIQFWASRIQ